MTGATEPTAGGLRRGQWGGVPPQRAVAWGLLCAVLWWGLAWLGVFERAQWSAYHLLFELRGSRPAASEITVVTIDEPSLEALGAWPVSRRLWAELVEGLFRSGARVVGLDVTFVQPALDASDDRVFAEVLSRHPGRVVLAANFQPTQSPSLQGAQLILPQRELRAVADVGIVDLPFDADGAIHRFPAFVEGLDADDVGRQKRYEGFALALASRYQGEAFTVHGPQLINFSGPPGWLRRVSLISALEALRSRDSRVEASFAHKIVLVGATALRLQDQYPTPFSATFTGEGSATYMPGVEIHAHAVATVLRNNAIRTLPEAPGFVLILLWGASLGAGLIPRSPRQALALLVAVLTVAGACTVAVFGVWNLWLDPVVPFGIASTVFVLGVGVQYVQAETQRRLTRRTFERYVDREIVDMLLAKPWLAPRMGGEAREVTILFSDVRSFTTLSEQRTPEQVVAFLNAYLAEMAQVIRREHGCIDKYIGDAILAVWGNVLPLSSEEAACRAVRAGLKMLERLEAKQSEWAMRGFPNLAIGIGINTGEAVVGNIGSPEKMEFGVIGDAVNVASRLEGLTKEHGALLISGRTRALLGDAFECEWVGPVSVKGRVQAVEIWRVLAEC